MTDREELRRLADEQIQRWEIQLADGLSRLFDEQEAVVLGRLRGRVARKNTRHWDPPGERKVDDSYVVSAARWVVEAADMARKIMQLLMLHAFRTTMARLREHETNAEAEEIASFSDDAVLDLLRPRLDRRLDMIVQGVTTAATEVQQVISQGEEDGKSIEEIADDVKQTYADRKQTWTERIVTTNVVGALNESALSGASSAGAQHKQWLSAHDHRTRPTHRDADGQVVPITAQFQLGGIPAEPRLTLLDFPGDPTGPPHEVINCRCTLIFPLSLPGQYEPGDIDFADKPDPALVGLKALDDLETKRRVRTPEGSRRYKLPIGAVIGPRMVDRYGNTVEVARLTTDKGTREVYVARAPNGVLLGHQLGNDRELTTPDELASAGVDLASLVPASDSPRQPSRVGSAHALGRRAAQGGFTYDPRKHKYPKSGYVVAVPGHSHIVPKAQWNDDVLANYLEQSWDELQANENLYLGGWLDKAHNEVVLDLVEVLSDREEAVRRGQERNEQAVFDLATLTEIPTGGTGGREELGLKADGPAMVLMRPEPDESEEDFFDRFREAMDDLIGETKALRRVRTPEGARLYDQPIGSVIVPNASAEPKMRGIHFTTPEAATAIRAGGFVVKPTLTSWGNGVYLALDDAAVEHFRDNRAKQGATAMLRVRVDVEPDEVLHVQARTKGGPRNDLDVHAALAAAGHSLSLKEFRRKTAGGRAAEFGPFLKKYGYKAMVVSNYGGGGTIAVIFDPDRTRVVDDDEPWDTETKGWKLPFFSHGGGQRHVATWEGAQHYNAPIGTPIKAKPKKPYPKALGSLKDMGDGLDTPSSAFGMRYEKKVAKHPLIQQAKTEKWGSVPTHTYDLAQAKLIATEERLRSKPIKRVLDGEPFRSGYDPQILRTDAGDIVIDGHHRVAMHLALGHQSMPAKVLDIRGGKSLAQALADVETARKEAEARREAELEVQAAELAAKKVAQATAAEPSITPLIQAVVTAHGGHMEGLEHRLKTLESTKGKILRVAHRKGIGASSAASQISDVLRYTAVIPTDDYSAGVKATLAALKQAGFSPTVTNNYWPKGDAYSGLNLLFYGKGQDLEIQFHTPESTATKALAHADYDICRDDTKPLEERKAAWDRMVPLWDDVPQPAGWPDFGSLFIYDPPGGGRGRYVSKWEAQGLPEPPKPKPQTGDDWFSAWELASDDAPSLFGSPTKKGG